MEGIEPPLKVLETFVLPLNYIRMMEDRDLNPRPLASTGNTHASRILIISIHAPYIRARQYIPALLWSNRFSKGPM